jgi:hypothetical protein
MENMQQIFSETNTTGTYVLVYVLIDKPCNVMLLNIAMLAVPPVI